MLMEPFLDRQIWEFLEWDRKLKCWEVTQDQVAKLVKDSVPEGMVDAWDNLFISEEQAIYMYWSLERALELLALKIKSQKEYEARLKQDRMDRINWKKIDSWSVDKLLIKYGKV